MGNCPSVVEYPVVVTLVEALGIILILDCALALVGPRFTFYAAAFLSLLVAAAMALYPFGMETVANPTLSAGSSADLILAAATLVLSLLAARSRTPVSEQSHPMNLPVFG